MRTYLRILRTLRPYVLHLTLASVFMVGFSVFSTTSIWMISPFLSTLFSDAPLASGVPAPDLAGAEGILDAAAGGRAEAWRDRIQGFLDERLLTGSKQEALLRIVVVFFVLFLLKNAFGYVQAVLMAYVGQRVIQGLRDALFLKLTNLPLGFFHRRRAGELISRATNDVQIANKCVNVSFTNFIRDPILIVMYLGMAFLISWRLTLVALIVLPLSTTVIVKIGRKLRKYSHRQQEKLANVTSVVHETVYGMRIIKAFAMERFENAKFLRESEHLFRDVFKISRTERLSSPLTEQLSVLIALFILWYGGEQVLTKQQLAPDHFILLLVCIFSVVQPVKELSQVNNGIQEGLAAAERIFEVMDEPEEVGNDEGGRELRSVRGAVTFEHVTFGHGPGEPVLRDVSLSVAPGEIVALVGASGAGKSTLVDLIPRFYDVQEGRILVDGVDVRELRLSSLRRALGIVTQEVILFNDTVRANIAYGQPEATDDDIERAARAANAHDFIAELPDGYGTMLGDRGVRLSGGERQRVSIARAILKNPPILIFDEATSALDAESERLVQEAIDRLVRNRTTFVIAHRLSTIQNVDRIYALQEGRIVQVGSHRELLSQGGLYRDLYELQFRA